MDSEDVSEINSVLTSKFMTAKELVELKKPTEQLQPSVGIKLSSRSGTILEKEAVDSALENIKDLLSSQNGARICDLIKAEWNKELNAAVTEKLKGKLSQHMGKNVDDKILLSTEESLFLLENGCIEILNGKVPMSMEEANVVMLKESLSLEKYQVYSHLSQLGFIVIPHQKKLIQECSKSEKNIQSQQSKRKRVNLSPLPEKKSRKRLTFSGALSENSDNCKVSSSSIEDDLNIINGNIVFPPKDIDVSHTPTNDNNLITDNKVSTLDQEPEHKNFKNSTKLENSVIESEKLGSTAEEAHSSVKSKEVTSALCDEVENLVSSTASKSPSNENRKKSLETIPNTSYQEMNIDSESSEVFIVSDKLSEKNKTDSKETDNEETCLYDFPKSTADPTINVNEGSLDVMSCSSNSASNDNYDNGGDSKEVCIDDDITLLEVTKKEITPLAVIDLLSEDEEHDQVAEDNDSSSSDDEIKVIKMYNTTAEDLRNQTNSDGNESKIKTKKMIMCKREGRNSQSVGEDEQLIQFPDMFRKDLVCVARPFPSLLPLPVQVNKEVYILDINRNSGAHSESRSQQNSKPLWNSFRDMQEYQRARRRNRHSNVPQPTQTFYNKNRNLQNSQHFDGFSRNQRHSNNQINNLDFRNSPYSPRNQTLSINGNSSPHSRSNDVDYRDHSLLREQSRDMDYRNLGSNNDIKPLRRLDPTDSTAPYPSLNNPNHQIPQFTNSSSVNSVISIGQTGRDFGNHPINNYSGTSLLNRPHLPSSSHLGNQDFLAQVHRTAYSYATTMLSSMLGHGFNSNILSPFLPGRNIIPFGQSFPNSFGGPQFNSVHLPYIHNRPNFGDHYRPRPTMQSPFPCMGNKRSWNDVRAAIGENDESSNDDSSDVEEIPISINEFLWKVSKISPLVKSGIKHPLSDVVASLKKVQAAYSTDKNSKNNKSFPKNTSLEITFDVYLPGTNFKKTCPGIPNYRIIVVSSASPIPKVNEIAVLKRQWNDGASLQIAVVDAGEISFTSFREVCLPDMFTIS